MRYRQQCVTVACSRMHAHTGEIERLVHLLENASH